ncbi:MAG: hypothetical protein AAFP19_17440 [Bacteroidota bacterium]
MNFLIIQFSPMPVWLSTILEIIKVTVPALIVFLTVYHLLKQYLEKEYKVRMLDYKQNQQKTTIPLRLQAYERLSLFCERISIPNLVLRLRTEGMTAAELRLAMMIAVQKEFEHNITQQVYVSDQLWQIIKIARDDVVNVINLAFNEFDPGADARDFSKAMFHYLQQRQAIPQDKALEAIKKEAGLLM